MIRFLPEALAIFRALLELIGEEQKGEMAVGRMIWDAWLVLEGG